MQLWSLQTCSFTLWVLANKNCLKWGTEGSSVSLQLKKLMCQCSWVWKCCGIYLTVCKRRYLKYKCGRCQKVWRALTILQGKGSSLCQPPCTKVTWGWKALYKFVRNHKVHFPSCCFSPPRSVNFLGFVEIPMVCADRESCHFSGGLN